MSKVGSTEWYKLKTEELKSEIHQMKLAGSEGWMYAIKYEMVKKWNMEVEDFIWGTSPIEIIPHGYNYIFSQLLKSHHVCKTKKVVG